MRRYPDWETRLAAYLEPLRDRPFQWGRHDCCTFAAGAVRAMTGKATMAEFRGKYRDEAGAAEALKTTGAGTLISTMNSKFKRVAPGHAHRGDIVMVDGNLGISFGEVSLHVGAEGERQGLIRHPRARWRKAWIVPMPGADHG
jgi:hypothetical protein